MFPITELTLKKIKEPAFLVMFMFAVILGFCVSGLEVFTDNESATIVGQLISPQKGSPLLSSSFFAIGITIVIAVFTAATEIPRDVDTRMVMMLITKPIRKFDYLLGKYIGILLLCILVFTVTEITIVVTHYMNTNELYAFKIIARQFYLLMILFPLIAITIAISCFTGDISAMIFTVLYILFSISISMLPLLMAVLPESMTGGLESYVLLIYYFFPNFIYFFQTFKLVGITAVATLVYSLSITVIFLIIAAVRLKNRDLIP